MGNVLHIDEQHKTSENESSGQIRGIRKVPSDRNVKYIEYVAEK